MELDPTESGKRDKLLSQKRAETGVAGGLSSI
jgi:hypothetical protein